VTPTEATDLHEAVAAATRVVDGVRPEQWASPTPCLDWTAAQLLTHLATGTAGLAAGLRGEDPSPVDDDPAAAFHRATTVLLEATSQPGLPATVTIPVGTVPVPVALGLRTTELLVHGWDLARATDQTMTAAEEAVERAIGFSRGFLGRVPADRTPFAPPQPVADDAPALDRLAALLGRDPG